jgi:hypothetical protein
MSVDFVQHVCGLRGTPPLVPPKAKPKHHESASSTNRLRETPPGAPKSTSDDDNDNDNDNDNNNNTNNTNEEATTTTKKKPKDRQLRSATRSGLRRHTHRIVGAHPCLAPARFALIAVHNSPAKAGCKKPPCAC